MAGCGVQEAQIVDNLEPRLMPELCSADPLIVPTLPAVIPDYLELDVTTGLHMTGEVQEIDISTYTLTIEGNVKEPVVLTYGELRCLPMISASPTLNCPMAFTDHASWTGIPFSLLLDMVDIDEDATQIRLYSADGFSAPVYLEEALQEDSFLALMWEDEVLPVLHGFPARAVFAGVEGSAWVKWVTRIVIE